MDEFENPFKKSGIALLIIGLVDIGIMAYCISNEISFSSSFNVFAVIAGIFLLKGGVKTARAVRWFSLFYIVITIGGLLVFPFAWPTDLIIAKLKVDTVSILGSVLSASVVMATMCWLYLQLSMSASLDRLSKAGYSTRRPNSAIAAGMALTVVIVSASSFFLNGEAAQKAITLAEQQLGTGFKYHVSSLSVHGDSGSVTVSAYSEDEVRNVQVHW